MKESAMLQKMLTKTKKNEENINFLKDKGCIKMDYYIK